MYQNNNHRHRSGSPAWSCLRNGQSSQPTLHCQKMPEDVNITQEKLSSQPNVSQLLSAASHFTKVQDDVYTDYRTPVGAKKQCWMLNRLFIISNWWYSSVPLRDSRCWCWAGPCPRGHGPRAEADCAPLSAGCSSARPWPPSPQQSPESRRNSDQWSPSDNRDPPGDSQEWCRGLKTEW